MKKIVSTALALVLATTPMASATDNAVDQSCTQTFTENCQQIVVLSKLDLSGFCQIICPDDPEMKPEETPEQTPDTEPEETPEQTPDTEPEETPEQTPDIEPEETPEQTPDIEPEETPEQTPDTEPEETPEQTPDTEPEETPGQTPDIKPEETPDNTPEQQPDASLSDYAAEVVRLVNVEREKNGLAALSVDTGVQAAAQVRAVEQAELFSHTRPNGSSCFTALTEQGVTYRTAGENIAYGQQSPEAVMNAWMNSSGHRANILSSQFTKIGVGYTVINGTPYWTQMFIS